jgi:hypothetical protein
MSKKNSRLGPLERVKKFLKISKNNKSSEPTCCSNILESAKSLEKVHKETTKIMNKNVDDLYNDARKWHG